MGKEMGERLRREGVWMHLWLVHELPGGQAGFRKGRGKKEKNEKAEEPEIKLPTSTESSKKQESSGKTSISALLTMPKPLTMWIKTSWKMFMGIPDHLTCLL